MFIYSDIYENDFLIKAEVLKTVNHYKMEINGWYCGGFSAASDTEALAIFKTILEGEK
jgi:hypothetical protein